MMMSVRVASVLLVSLFAFNHVAQSGDKGKAGSDANFVQKVSECDLAEIELAKLAAKQATNARVKEFANRMMTDHQKCSDELTTIAKKQNLRLTTEISQQRRDAREKLSKTSGADFDRQYISGQVKAHREAVELFKDQAKSGQNADLRNFANKQLPTIEEHLRQAQDIERTLDKSK